MKNDIFWLVLKLEINNYNRVIICMLKDFGFLLEDFWKVIFLGW
jgi:hypothetical protein